MKLPEPEVVEPEVATESDDKTSQESKKVILPGRKAMNAYIIDQQRQSLTEFQFNKEKAISQQIPPEKFEKTE